MSFQILKSNRQSKPGSPLRAHILRISFGWRVPRRGHDWFPVSETSLQPRRSTAAFVRFWISTYSLGLSTKRMSTESPLVGITGGCEAVAEGCEAVRVGSAVPVAVGAVCVGRAVPVGGEVSVGSAVEKGCVGNGVKVGKSKSNRSVGVDPPSWLGSITGLETAVEAAPLPQEGKLTSTGQRQQNGSTNRNTRSILPV